MRKPSILKKNKESFLATLCNECLFKIHENDWMFHGTEDKNYHLHVKCGDELDKKSRGTD